jgi:hypothetical protein
VLSGASIVIRASMWSQAKRSIGAISPTSSAAPRPPTPRRSEKRPVHAQERVRARLRDQPDQLLDSGRAAGCVRISTCHRAARRGALDEQLGVLRDAGV